MTTPDRPQPLPPLPQKLPKRRAPRTRDAVVPTDAKGTASGVGRWVRAVEGELVNLDGCDYVAVEEEDGQSYAVVARMHGGAANWVLARYGSQADATRAQDWLAQHLKAWRLDLVAAETAVDSNAGQPADTPSA